MEHIDARRLYQLVEPIGLVAFFADEPPAAMAALGLRGYWDGYFAARSAPLGVVPAEVVDALFYNFGPGEVARHVPRVWDVATPAAALAARQQGCVAGLRRVLGDLADGPGLGGLARSADLLVTAATSADWHGRPMYAALRALPIPDEPVARLWHAADLLREHRGDGHVAALVTAGVGGLESHVLHALSEGTPARSFGRIHHLPTTLLSTVIDGLRGRGLLDDAEQLTAAGREVKAEVEATTDRLAVAPYRALAPADLDELAAGLEPLAAALAAAWAG